MRPGPIVGGAVNPYIERLPAAAGRPVASRCPTTTRRSRTCWARRSARSSSRTRSSRSRWPSPGFSPGEAEGLRRAMSRKRSAAAIEAYHERFVQRAMAALRRRRRRSPSASGRWSRASRASASPRPTAPRSGCWPTSRPGCACTTAPEFLAAAARRAADGLLPARRAGPRGAAARDRGPGARRQRSRTWAARSSRSIGAARSASGWATCSGVRGRRRRRRWSRAREAGRAVSDRSRISRRAPARGGRRWSSSRGRARATRWPAAIAAARCGSSAWRRRASAATSASRGSEGELGTQLALPLGVRGGAGAAGHRPAGRR